LATNQIAQTGLSSLPPVIYYSEQLFTIADIYIRYSYSKDELVSIGRPVIYSVVDSFSGMIVGIHVGFDSPCWHGASQALFNAT
ncbi:hypothetical protein, partial [Aeromonas allosaccharophila]|uniref:hypothetical protein n=1 Tax=Aeromonas allosaccharophila TaxID=656 RepID=UPI002B47D777